MKFKLIIYSIAFIIAQPAFAGLSDELSQLVGYTIQSNKTISGWYDKDGNKGNNFEGCKYDRIITFSDNTALTCRGYGYQYSYLPNAVILSNGSDFKMIIEDTIYDMSNY